MKLLGMTLSRDTLMLRKILKKAIIDALNECDDFSVTFSSSDSYWGDSNVNWKLLKLKLNLMKTLKRGERKQRIRNKELAERRKRKKEQEEKERREEGIRKD
jgi:hypothetical protein